VGLASLRCCGAELCPPGCSDISRMHLKWPDLQRAGSRAELPLGRCSTPADVFPEVVISTCSAATPLTLPVWEPGPEAAHASDLMLSAVPLTHRLGPDLGSSL